MRADNISKVGSGMRGLLKFCHFGGFRHLGSNKRKIPKLIKENSGCQRKKLLIKICVVIIRT